MADASNQTDAAPLQPVVPSPGLSTALDNNFLQDLGETLDLPADTAPTTPAKTPRRLADTDDDQSPERHISPFCFVESIRQLHSVEDIEHVRQQLGSRPGAEGAYSRADALKYAVLYGHSTYSAWLLREHAPEALAAPVCCPLLLTAVRLDRADVVEQLCRLSRQVKQAVPYVDSRGCASMESRRTALHVAAEMSSITIATTLLRYGADHTARDQFGMTPLDRLLHTLPGPHINFNTVRLAWELIRCLPALQVRTLHAWTKLSSRNSSWEARLHPDCRHLKPGPFSLMQITRTQIRKMVGYPRLPDGIQQLPIPPVMQKFLVLDW